MRCCDRHWGALRQAINDRGLSHLVAPDKETAEENWRNQQFGEECTDPLMTCFVMITSEAFKQGGAEMLLPDEHGEPKCPICEAVKYTPVPADETEDNWTNGVADAVLQDFRERRLALRLQ